jgi:hypothetical protein
MAVWAGLEQPAPAVGWETLDLYGFHDSRA